MRYIPCINSYLLIAIMYVIIRINISTNCVSPKDIGRSQTEYLCNHHNLTEIPTDLSSDLTYLDLSFNKMYVLHESAFKNIGNLKKLFLGNNKLWKITELAFSYLSHLEYLSLVSNNLVIQSKGLSPYAFTYLPRLQFLELSSNPLGQLPAKLFSKLLNLRELYINNAVYGLKIEDGAFDGLAKLKVLSLTNNHLKTLSAEHQPAFNTMNLEKLYLDGNLWNCDCKLKWLRLWVEKKRANMVLVTTRTENSIHYQPTCTDLKSERSRDISMFNIRIHSFQCHPNIFSKPSYVTVPQLGNVTFSCSFYSDPKTYVKWYKGNTFIGDHWDRMIRKTSNGHFFTANLTIIDVRLVDEGIYICETGNDRGNVSTNHTLTVKQIYMGKLKLDKVVILVGIGALGLIVLLAAIGIIVYCFYGRDAMKINANNRNNGAGVIQNNTLKHQQVPLLPPNSNPLHQTSLLDGVPDMHVDDYLSHPTATEHNAVVKRLLTNGALESMHNSSASNSLLRNEIPMSSHLAFEAANSQRSDSLSPTNEDCPVHGLNRQNFHTCPVHGNNSDSHESDVPLGGGGGPPFMSFNSDSYGKSSACPVHSAESGASTQTQPNSLFTNAHKAATSSTPLGMEVGGYISNLQSRTQAGTLNNSDFGFMRATAVDDCVTVSSAVFNGAPYSHDSPGLFITSELNPHSERSLNFLKPISKKMKDPDTVV